MAPQAGIPVTDRPLRIMIVSDQYEPMIGGVPTVTRDLACGLAKRGHSVVLVVPSPVMRGKLGSVGAATVNYRPSVRWPWYEGMRLGCIPRFAARRLITSFAPDVAHIHSPVTIGVMVRIGAGSQRVPVVYTNHYLPANVRPSYKPQSRALTAVFYRHVIGFSNRCTHVTAPTATALGLLRDHGLRVPSRVISNGIDTRTYCPGPADAKLLRRYDLEPGTPVILSVGRLSPEKRNDVLLAAAARLSRRAQVVVAGTGPEQGKLRAMARRLGLSESVRFPGFVPAADLPALYRLADVFAIASQAELQSLTTMEAMASGLPVVAVDACALGELVVHERNGFLTRPGDAPDMAARLELLISDQNLQSQMSAASLEIIKGHDRDRCLAEWESLYGLLASARSGER